LPLSSNIPRLIQRSYTPAHHRKTISKSPETLSQWAWPCRWNYLPRYIHNWIVRSDFVNKIRKRTQVTVNKQQEWSERHRELGSEMKQRGDIDAVHGGAVNLICNQLLPCYHTTCIWERLRHPTHNIKMRTATRQLGISSQGQMQKTQEKTSRPHKKTQLSQSFSLRMMMGRACRP